MSILTALKARRDALRDREAGFTLIELLVVVIIIGILAAIAIPVYLGVQNNAKDSAAKSDLTNDKVAIVAYGTDNNGAIPTAFAVTDFVKYGASQSSGTGTPAYSVVSATDGTWCLSETSATNTSFKITSSAPVTTGTCS